MNDGPPRISILIPNYNNGPESSLSGKRDFIGDLFLSLEQTLADDPTPLEIIIADDGSTDSSLQTCREWSKKIWRGGEPFCELIEFEHTGVLSVVANRLMERARGEICCRLDGDIVILTENWASMLCEIFDNGPPRLGVVGPKQFGLDGRIHSAGSWILHPRGHHHIANGAISETVTRSIEVDHVMGCFYCHKREVWENLGGYDETILRGQTVDFGLRARLDGWRTFSVPHIWYQHAHGDRIKRPNEADTPEGIEASLDRFKEKWGFDRIAPDLDVAAERYRGTPLLWNARAFGPSVEWPRPSASPVSVQQSEWGRYATDDVFRQVFDMRVNIGLRLGERYSPLGRVLHVFSRSGLLCHLLAQTGLECVGVESDPDYVELARSQCRGEDYPCKKPEFIQQKDDRRLPLNDGSVDAVLLYDVLETHPNPVGLLQEAHRALSEDGVIAIVTMGRNSPFEGDHDALHAYRLQELVFQIQGSRYFRPIAVEGLPEIPGAVTLFGERRNELNPTYHVSSEYVSKRLVCG